MNLFDTDPRLPREDAYVVIDEKNPEKFEIFVKKLSEMKKFTKTRLRIDGFDCTAWRATRREAFHLSRELREEDLRLFTFYIRDELGNLIEVPMSKEIQMLGSTGPAK